MNLFRNFRPSLLFIFSIFILQSFSCKKSGNEVKPDPKAESIKLSVQTDTISVDESLTIFPTISPAMDNPSSKYKWNTENKEIAGIEVNPDFSVTVTGKKKGIANIGVYSFKGELMAYAKIVVEEKPYQDDGIVKILAIGNSFSEDAIEQYLHGLATAGGFKAVVANLYIGGSSLSEHAANAANDARAYSYRKIGLNGNKAVTENTSISTALADEDWDYISYQQVSQNSGQYNTFTTPLPALHNYVKTRAKNPDVKYVLHQTWAYAQNSTHSGFANYNNNQQTMYEAIVSTYKQAKTLINADIVVPAGTAIQNGRASLIGDNFTRDGYHLDLNIGRYTASCAWFEAIFGKSVVGNTFKPSGLGELQTEIAQQAAHFAVQQPDKVNPMSDYQDAGGEPLTKPAYINFGSNTGVPASWNSLGGYTAGSSIPIIRDESGTNTSVSLKVITKFNGRNADGPNTTNTDMNIPASVSSDSYFGNARKEFGGLSVPESIFKIEGLDNNKSYDLCFFAARMNVGDNRETKYTVKGTSEVTVNLNASNNSSQSVCAAGIKPDSDGAITVTLTMGSNNNNEYGFYYINAMKIAPN